MKIVQLIGAPYDAGCRDETSDAIDQRNGPAAIRQAFLKLTSGFNIPIEFDDLGDVRCNNTVQEVLQTVQDKVIEVSKNNLIPFILGGAHTLTLGSLRAFYKQGIDFSLVYLDAHPDMMPHREINYGSTLYYALEEKILAPQRIGLIGLRNVETDEWNLIREKNIFNVPSIEIEPLGIVAVLEQIKQKLPPPYFISIDLDSLDPTAAPGVTSPYPGGLTYREVLYLTSELCKSELVGIDIVELSPINDRNNETARIAATLLQKLSTIIADSATSK